MNDGLCINKTCGLNAQIEMSTGGVVNSGVIRNSLLTKMGELLACWKQRARTRRYLAQMPRHLLSDIGIDESQRQQELDKPFWRQGGI